jgi:hypothetical protein
MDLEGAQSFCCSGEHSNGLADMPSPYYKGPQQLSS